MARFLPPRMESELAFPGRFRHNRRCHHQDVSRPHWYSSRSLSLSHLSSVISKSNQFLNCICRGGCEELQVRAEAQEVNLSRSCPNFYEILESAAHIVSVVQLDFRSVFLARRVHVMVHEYLNCIYLYVFVFRWMIRFICKFPRCGYETGRIEDVYI